MSAAEIERVLYEHREDALVCYDHPDDYCCVCGEHRLTVSWRTHVAQVIADGAA